MHEDVQLAKQLERMSRWKDPIVDAVVATALYRRRAPMVDDHDYGTHEFLVTERQRGAAKGHHQAHHGGFLKPTDKNVTHGAAREIKEETGLIVPPESLQFVGRFGPELYRSHASAHGLGNIELTILDVQAEPGIPFVLDLFVADVSNVDRVSETDKEVNDVGFRTLGELLAAYGSSDKFNYWSFLIPAILTISGKDNPRVIWESQPGKYVYPLDMVYT